VHFTGHHSSVDETPGHKGLCTLTHFYTMQIQCRGLPAADFSTVSPGTNGDPGSPIGPTCQGFIWTDVQRCIDHLHGVNSKMARRQNFIHALCMDQEQVIQCTARTITNLSAALDRLASKASELGSNGDGQLDACIEESRLELAQLEGDIASLQALKNSSMATAAQVDTAQDLPPSMLSMMNDTMIMPPEEWHKLVVRRDSALAEPQQQSSRTSCNGDKSSCNGYIAQGPCSDMTVTAPQVGADTAMPAASPKADKLAEMFMEWDRDGSGTISQEALVGLLETLPCAGLTPEQIREVCTAGLANMDGSVNYMDLIGWLYQGKSLHR